MGANIYCSSIDDEDKSCYTQKNEAVKQTKEAVEKLGRQSIGRVR